MRTKPDVLEIIQTAFLPLRCVAELHDYDQKVRFRVFSPEDEALLFLEGTPIDSLVQGNKLATVLEHARRRIEKKGYRLNQWSLSD